MRKSKLLSLGLAALLTLSSVSASATGLGRISDRKNLELRDGIHYSRIKSENELGRQDSYYIRFDYETAPLEAKVVFGPYIKGGDRLSEIVRAYEEEGKEVLFATNGDSYYADGVPKGVVISDGIFHSSGATYMRTLGFTRDKKLVSGYLHPKVDMTIGGAKLPIYYVNNHLDSFSTPVHLLTSKYSTRTGIKSAGVEVVVNMGEDFDGLRLGQSFSGKVVKINQLGQNLGGSNTPIGPNEIVLNASNLSPHYPLLTSRKVGQHVYIDIDASGDRVDWSNVQEGLSAFASLVERKEVQWDNYMRTQSAPRTSIGYLDGNMGIMVNDGRQSQAVGLSYKNLIDFHRNIGYVDIFNMDGGGSSVLMMKMPGDDRARIINSLSDEGHWERYNGNGLIFFAAEGAAPAEEVSEEVPEETEVTETSTQPSYRAARLHDFEADLAVLDWTSRFYNEDGERGGSAEVSINEDIDYVKEGKKSLRVDYDFETEPLTGTVAVEIGPEGSKKLEGSPRAIGMWVYGDGQGALLRTELGSEEYIGDTVIDFEGWKYLEIQLPEGSDHELNWAIRVVGQEDSDVNGKKGTLYFDQVKLIYGEAGANKVGRIGGANRYETAVNIAKEILTDSKVAVITNSENYPDALVAAPLARRNTAPILLAGQDLPETTLNSLELRKAEKVIILGGVNSVSEEIEAQLEELGYQVTRIAGEDRYETSLEAGQLAPNKKIVYMASGENYPDALSIGNLAMRDRAPVVLTSKDSLGESTIQALEDWEVDKVVIAGGENSIDRSVVEELEAMDIQVERIAGDNRYSTSAKIAEAMKVSGYSLASGAGYIDPLTAGPASNYRGRAVLLVEKNQLGPGQYLLEEEGLDNVFIIGGVNSLSQELEDSLKEILK